MEAAHHRTDRGPAPCSERTGDAVHGLVTEKIRRVRP